VRYTTKDNFQVKGHAVSYGTDSPFFQILGSEDCAVKEAMDRAGHQWMGVSKCTPFACGNLDPSVIVDGRVAGGSSSGSAHDVATAVAEVGIGSDVGGSCRTPALRARLVGYKGSSGEVDRRGMYKACSDMESVGWLCRDVATSAQVWRVLATPQRKGWSSVRHVQEVQGPMCHISGAWYAGYLPQFYANAATFNGLFHKTPTKHFVRVYARDKALVPPGRDTLPLLVKGRLVAGCALSMECDPSLEESRVEYLRRLQGAYPPTQLLITPGSPGSTFEPDSFDDRWLLLANMLDRPAMVLPLGERGLQLIGPRGSGQALHRAASEIMTVSRQGGHPLEHPAIQQICQKYLT